jgi:[ribosomal protein S18]-alanine N-acetyltransferase
MTTVRFEELGAEHLEAVADLESRVNPQPWSYDLFAGELDVDVPARHWLVVVDEADQMIGFGGVMYVVDEAHLMNLAVEPACRRTGIARRLIGHLFLEAVERGARNLTLEVRASNAAAIALYRRFDFAPVGVRSGYYPDGEDALVLWVHDIDRPDYCDMLTAAVSLGTEVRDIKRVDEAE